MNVNTGIMLCILDNYKIKKHNANVNEAIKHNILDNWNKLHMYMVYNVQIDQPNSSIKAPRLLSIFSEKKTILL